MSSKLMRFMDFENILEGLVGDWGIGENEAYKIGYDTGENTEVILFGEITIKPNDHIILTCSGEYTDMNIVDIQQATTGNKECQLMVKSKANEIYTNYTFIYPIFYNEGPGIYTPTFILRLED